MVISYSNFFWLGDHLRIKTAFALAVLNINSTRYDDIFPWSIRSLSLNYGDKQKSWRKIRKKERQKNERTKDSEQFHQKLELKLKRATFTGLGGKESYVLFVFKKPNTALFFYTPSVSQCRYFFLHCKFRLCYIIWI